MRGDGISIWYEMFAFVILALSNIWLGVTLAIFFALEEVLIERKRDVNGNKKHKNP
jgi:hypothetical protein